MKKGFALILLTFYVAAVFGITVDRRFCCHEGIVLTETHEDCGICMDQEEPHCPMEAQAASSCESTTVEIAESIFSSNHGEQVLTSKKTDWQPHLLAILLPFYFSNTEPRQNFNFTEIAMSTSETIPLFIKHCTYRL